MAQTGGTVAGLPAEAVRMTAREMAEQLVGTIENRAAARAAQTNQRTELEAAAEPSGSTCRVVATSPRSR